MSAPGEAPPSILVVDDDRALRSTMIRALERAGYRVYSAGNGFEARRALDQADNKVDVVVMDLVLPGLEGQEVANLLKAHHPAVRVVYTSGFSSLESVRSGAMREGEPFLRKPFEIAELLDAVEKALEG